MPHHVVVIDDSDTDLLYARILLERTGLVATLRVFDCAREGLAYLATPEGASVDLVLLDINMPGMDGFEFLEAYEQQTPHPVRVVMLTSSPDPVDRLRAQRHACVGDYLTKPLDMAAARALCSPTPD